MWAEGNLLAMEIDKLLAMTELKLTITPVSHSQYSIPSEAQGTIWPHLDTLLKKIFDTLYILLEYTLATSQKSRNK